MANTNPLAPLAALANGLGGSCTDTALDGGGNSGLTAAAPKAGKLKAGMVMPGANGPLAAVPAFAVALLPMAPSGGGVAVTDAEAGLPLAAVDVDVVT